MLNQICRIKYKSDSVLFTTSVSAFAKHFINDVIYIITTRSGMPVRNGNLSSDRTTTTKAASVRKQLGPKNSKSDEGRQAKNGGKRRECRGA